MVILKPQFKDPRQYIERKDLIDYINHLTSEQFKLIDAYNEMENKYNRLERKLIRIYTKVDEIYHEPE